VKGTLVHQTARLSRNVKECKAVPRGVEALGDERGAAALGHGGGQRVAAGQEAQLVQLALACPLSMGLARHRLLRYHFTPVFLGVGAQGELKAKRESSLSYVIFKRRIQALSTRVSTSTIPPRSQCGPSPRRRARIHQVFLSRCRLWISRTSARTMSFDFA